MTFNPPNRHQRVNDVPRKGVTDLSHGWSKIAHGHSFAQTSCSEFYRVCTLVALDGSTGRQRDPRIAVCKRSILVESLTSPYKDTILKYYAGKVKSAMPYCLIICGLALRSAVLAYTSTWRALVLSSMPQVQWTSSPDLAKTIVVPLTESPPK